MAFTPLKGHEPYFPGHISDVVMETTYNEVGEDGYNRLVTEKIVCNSPSVLDKMPNFVNGSSVAAQIMAGQPLKQVGTKVLDPDRLDSIQPQPDVEL